MRTNWFEKKVLILGLSKSGIAAAKYLNKKGADVYLTEKKAASEEDKAKIQELESLGIKVETGGHSDDFIKEAYIAITSPGIPPHSEIMKKLADANIHVISEIELAYTQTSIPFIAITGTNGKTTTTALTSHILSTEYKAPACGNIGKPPCDLIDDENDYLVCELSSYQLAMSPSLQPQISVWTNFTPDHIDWHQGLENYFEAKAKIFKFPQNPAFSVLNAKDSKLVEFAPHTAGELFFFAEDKGANCCFEKNEAIYYKRNGKEEEIIKLAECPLVGEHNYQNIMCAIICAKIVGISNEHIKDAIMSFKAPAHRLEKVAEINGTTFYNDSKGTNPEASIVAIKSFNEPNVVLIAGGRDKNTDLKEFCEETKKHIKTVILIGEAAQRFEDNLRANGFDNIIRENSLQSAIDKSLELHPNVALLSPACASFDMFKSYEERGEVFKEYVLSKLG